MPSLPVSEAELRDLRGKTFDARQEALEQSDQVKADALKKLLKEIDEALDDLAFGELQGLGSRLAEIRAKLDALTKKASSWPFGTAEASDDHELPFRAVLPENDSFDAGPGKEPPKPSPMPPDKVPVVTPGWSENYKKLWQAIEIRPEWQATAIAIAKKIIASQSRYASAVSGTSVPWWFIAVIHSMECSLKFDQHLHNGDPLSGRTVRVPRGRPPAGSPPFSWEESARDSIAYEKLDKVTDWSLTSVLFHWHRYNGINNKYKELGIPTPYLWSGSQHYRKGKYIKDGVFDAEAVSGQVGAAVLLKALIDLGAVAIDKGLDLASNAAAATGHVASLSVDTSGAAFKHVADELDYPGLLKIGSGKTKAERRAVRRVQEWLNIHEFVTAIDDGFGESTAKQLKGFQEKMQRTPTGELDEETWALLTAPMRRALAKIEHAGAALEDAVVRVALQHIREKPIEVGGNNCGPWVRLYMAGHDGAPQLWCAGFTCLIVTQAARDLGIAMPFKR